MILRMNIRIVFLYALLLPISAVAQQKVSAEEQLVMAINKALQGPLFAHTVAAVHITDLESGSVLYQRHADLLLRPASNAKIATSAAAVLRLDEDFRFRTKVAAIDSTLRRLVCVGSFDPLLNSQDIQKLAEMAYARGVRVVDTLFLDSSILDATFYGAGWMWDDESDPFMPYIGAFPVDGNTVQLRMKSPAQTGKSLEISVFPSSSLLQVENRAVSGTRTDLHIGKTPRSNNVVTEGTHVAAEG